MVDQETGKTGVGEADVELAEVAAFEQRQAARLAVMTRESFSDVATRIEKFDSKVLCEFTEWLEETTRLDDDCMSFARLVQAVCGEEMQTRFMAAHGFRQGGER